MRLPIVAHARVFGSNTVPEIARVDRAHRLDAGDLRHGSALLGSPAAGTWDSMRICVHESGIQRKGVGLASFPSPFGGMGFYERA